MPPSGEEPATLSAAGLPNPREIAKHHEECCGRSHRSKSEVYRAGRVERPLAGFQ